MSKEKHAYPCDSWLVVNMCYRCNMTENQRIGRIMKALKYSREQILVDKKLMVIVKKHGRLTKKDTAIIEAMKPPPPEYHMDMRRFQ